MLKTKITHKNNLFNTMQPNKQVFLGMGGEWGSREDLKLTLSSSSNQDELTALLDDLTSSQFIDGLQINEDSHSNQYQNDSLDKDKLADRVYEILEQKNYLFPKVISQTSSRFLLLQAEHEDGRLVLAKAYDNTSPLIHYLRKEAKHYNILNRLISKTKKTGYQPSINIPKLYDYIRDDSVEILIREYIDKNQVVTSELSEEKRLLEDLDVVSNIFKDFRKLSNVMELEKTGLMERDFVSHYHLVYLYWQALKQLDLTPSENVYNKIKTLFNKCAPFFDKYNNTIVHGDLHENNIIFYEDKIYLIDLEQTRIGNITEDFAAVLNSAGINNASREDTDKIWKKINSTFRCKPECYNLMLHAMRIKQILREMLFYAKIRSNRLMFRKNKDLLLKLVQS
ncbi:MAG: hypothetical protein ACD_58C00147G0009 [uncultured bacterium]|nr:MAG: hypothetical protein ACD_58C00147G0009 [uncultured bacterium]